MGGKKVVRAYVQENLRFLAQTLVRLRQTKGDEKVYKEIDHEGLEKAIKALPREDRENIERFWGLTGGINHSKKLGYSGKNDVAFFRQSNQAVTSLQMLFRLEYMCMFDKNLQAMVEILGKKLNKKDMDISDLEAIKYLMVFLVILQNGPKLPFEEELLVIDTECNPDFVFDEYSTIKGAVNDFKHIPDESINIKLIHDFLDMFDVEDVIRIKKSFRIEVPSHKIPQEIRNVEIETINTLQQVRNFKERVFEYGDWEITAELILGNADVAEKLPEFMECLDLIRKNWNKILDFKSGQRKLRTSNELRTLDVYNIGGLEFTDIYEVMFLYVERNIIDP